MPLEKTEPEDSARTKKKKPLLHKRKMASTAVAAVIMAAVFAVGGTVGVHAEKNGGFFHWLKKDETGVTMITSPQNVNVGTDTSSAVTYDSLDEVPEEYQEYVIEVEDLESLEGFELQRIETMEMNNFSKVYSVFSKMEDDRLLIVGTFVYSQRISFNRQAYIDYDFLYSLEEDTTEMEVFAKKHPKEETEETEYIVSFLGEDKEYFVQGKYDLETLEKIAKEYVLFLSN